MAAVKPVEYPTIDTERLHLRLLTLQDAEEVRRHFADEEITRFMDIDPCKDVKEAEEIIRYHLDDAGCRWGIYDQTSRSFMGTCGYHYLRTSDGEFVAEIGFDLAKDSWGRGYMTEAMQAVIRFGFETMKLTMIDATVEPDNVRSIHLMEKLGFVKASELQAGLVYFSKRREQ